MKPIPNCAGYFVNEIGECFSCVKKISGVNGKRGTYTIIDESSPVKLKSKTHSSNGYVYIALGKYGAKRLHRVVAAAFIPNPNDYPEINHIDEDKANCHLSNLRWVSRKENNNKFAYKRGGPRWCRQKRKEVKIVESDN